MERDITVGTETVRAVLLAMRDEGYAAFQRRLMPTVAPETVIGVRMPKLRAFAKAFGKTEEAKAFLSALPHAYYEENNLHALLVEGLHDYDETVMALDAFLPYVDNWATCDAMHPKAFARHTAALFPQIEAWIATGCTYTVRFGLGMLMTFYLGDAFDERVLPLAAGVRSEEYYVNMMTAWFFATALAKRYDETLPYLTGNALDAWTHNKAIQKAIESYRITDAQKTYLRTLKRKQAE